MMIFGWVRQWQRRRENALAERLRLERESKKAKVILKAMAEGRVIERPRTTKAICFVAMAICLTGTASYGADAVPAASYVFQIVAYPGAFQTFPMGINDQGDIVGSYTILGLPPFLQVGGRPLTYHAFLLQGGRYFQIDRPGSYQATAVGINNAGQIAGTAWELRGLGPDDVSAFLRVDENHYTTIRPTGAARRSEAYAINTGGDIIGVAVPGVLDPDFLWSAGQFLPGLFGPRGVSARALNAARRYIGYGVPNSPDPYCNCSDSYIADAASSAILAFPGAHITSAYAINDASQVAGSYIVLNDPGRTATIVKRGAFIYSNGQYQDVVFPAASATGLAGINGLGDVVGGYMLNSGETGSFVGFAPRAGVFGVTPPALPPAATKSIPSKMRAIAKRP